MLKRIKHYVLIVASTLIMTTPLTIGGVAFASTVCNNNIENNINTGIGATAGNPDSITNSCGTSATGSISGIAKKVIDIFSIVVGVISVFMIIYAGFRYITSGGDSGNTTGARNTLLYAIVGLIIVAIAQIIVRFVLSTANGISS